MKPKLWLPLPLGRMCRERGQGEESGDTHNQIVRHIAVRMPADHEEQETDALQSERDEAQESRHGAEAAEEAWVVHVWVWSCKSESDLGWTSGRIENKKRVINGKKNAADAHTHAHTNTQEVKENITTAGLGPNLFAVRIAVCLCETHVVANAAPGFQLTKRGGPRVRRMN